MKRTLDRQVILAFVAVTALPLLAVAVIGELDARREALRGAQERLQQDAQLLHAHLATLSAATAGATDRGSRGTAGGGVGPLNAEVLASVVSAYHGSRQVLLVDEAGQVRFVSDSVEIPALSLLPSSWSGREEVVVGHRRYAHARASVPGGWTVILLRSHEAILAAQSRYRTALLVATMTMLLLGLGLAAWFGRRIAGPITALAQWVKTFDLEGTSHVPTVPEHAPRELRDLADYLETTSNRLRFSFRRVEATTLEREMLNQQLKDVLAHLDRKVESRTRALTDALQSAEQANLTKSRFLANMSHELRTPLNSVIGFAALLRKNRHGALQPKDLDMLDRIQANGRHLLTLINDVLDVSKIEAGRMTLEVLPVDVAALARGVVADFDAQVPSRAVTVSYRGPESCIVETDEAKVRQIVVNLVGNAVKFTSAGEVSVRVDASDSRLELNVSDTGIGIPPDRLEAIFRPFVQADAATTRKYGGTGLGLTISRSMAEMLGGTLTVVSRSGEGTTFTLSIPVSAGVALPSPAAAGA